MERSLCISAYVGVGKHGKRKEGRGKASHHKLFDVTLFNRAYDWMKARGMSEGQSQHAALVVG